MRRLRSLRPRLRADEAQVIVASATSVDVADDRDVITLTVADPYR